MMQKAKLSSLSFPFLFCLILLLQFTPNTPYIFNGYQVVELDGTGSCFISDSASWAATRLQVISTTVYSTCAGTYLIGGYGVLGSTVAPYASWDYFYKSYSGLPNHNYIRFSFTVWALDTWDQNNSDGMNHNDAFQIGFDGLVVYGQSYYNALWTTQTNLCGGIWNDLSNIYVFGIVPHMGSTLLLKLISDLNEVTTNESFGFRDLSLLFDLNPPPYPEYESACGVAAISLNSNPCTCPKGQYYTGSSCATCDASCDSCYGSGPHYCYRCASGYSWNGYACVTCGNSFTDICSLTATTAPSLRCKSAYVYFATTNQCYYDCKYFTNKAVVACSNTQCNLACSATQFTYWDQSCSATCPAPLQQSTVWNVPLCIYPCGSTDYLYWDGTCHHDCPPPFTKSIIYTKNLCTTTCTSSQYVYPDGSCQSLCPSPLVSETIQGRNICKSPCNTPGEYLYTNGECSLTCDPLFTGTTTLGIQYCTSSCANYIYWNSTCLSTCTRPLTIRTQRGQKYCDYPTPTANFLYWDGSNSANCNSPLSQRIEGGRKFCDYTCPSYRYLYADGSCLNDCVFPWTRRIQGGQRFCDNPCSGANILYWNGSCLASTKCTAPLVLTSLAGSQLCQFPAGNTSNFLYWDGTFSATCDPPFTQRIEGSPMVRKFCDIPCSAPTPILNWDGQCIASCSSPYTTVTKGTKSMCFTPCSNSQYLYDNGTCQDDCIFPYVQIIYGAQKVCHNPCSNTNLYYYWNSSCLSSCDAPYQTQTVNEVNWCVYPCSGEQFVHSDGSCVDTCEKPFESFVVSNLKHCYNPCSFSKPYITQNGTCIASCNSPMTLDTSTNICSPPCKRADQFYYAADGECRDECDEAYVDSSDLYIRCLASAPVDTTSFLDVFLKAPSGSSPSLVSLARVVQYTRYLDITFPTNLRNLLQSEAVNIVTIRMGSSMSSETKATFPKYSLPHVFSEYSDLHSNFVVNFWKELTSWLIGCLLVLLFAALEALSKKKQWTNCENFFYRLKILVKWNYLLIMIGSSLGQIVLFSSLQIRTIHSGAPFTALGIELSLVTICLGLAVLLGVIYAVRQVQTIVAGNHPQSYNKNQEKWRPYQILYKGFNDNIYLNRIFYLVYAVRLLLPFLIASWCYFSPVFQTLLYTIISVLTLAYIWKAQPILRRLNQIQLVVLESLVLFINIGLLLLAFLNASGKSQTSLAVTMGDLIVFANTCINIMLLVVLILKIILAIKAINNFNDSPNKDRPDLHPWPQLFVGIMQQGGMGFEEISFEEYMVHEDDDFRSGMLMTDKGIKAKGRSWDSVRRNTKRIIPDFTDAAVLRRNARISKLFGGEASEELDPEEVAKDKQTLKEASPNLRPTLLVPNRRNRPGSQSTASPLEEEEEKDNFDDTMRNIRTPPQKSSQSPLRRRLNHRGTFLVDMAEQGAFGNNQVDVVEEEKDEQEQDPDVPVLISPDIMKGVTMADLKKVDLRDADHHQAERKEEDDDFDEVL